MTQKEKAEYLARNYINYTFCNDRIYAEIYTLIGVSPVIIDITDYDYSDMSSLVYG